MNQHLQKIRDFIEQLDTLSAEEKAALNKTVKNVDTDFSITEFKLDRTEKVKRTTAILLEETIEELEQKRRAVEDKNRNLEIEASLERVRARTMAMQHSTELQDAASILFRQVEALGVKSWSSGFNIFDDDKKACTAWHCSAGLMMPPFITPLTEDPTYIHFYEGSLTGEPLFVERVEGGALTAHYHYLRTLPGLREMLAELSEEGFAIPACQINHAAYFTYGYLLFITFEPVPEAHDIFRRFAKVFEQTYTRFLDLKQAEAQAREAQIQLALERVRARTMAMQHSSELGDASFVLDSQVRDLGIETWGCAFNIYGDNESTEWFSSEAGTLPAYKTPRENIFLSYYETGKQNESMFTREYAGEACVDHYEYLCTIPVLGETLKRLKETGVSFPQRQIDNIVYFKYGYVLFITLKPSPESHDIFKRFAAVFEQTYTRFLDLQKAEGQAREAQIEAALERTRTQSMIMQHSSELDDTLRVFHEQVLHLGIGSAFSFLWLPDEEHDRHLFWAAWAEKDSTNFNSKAIDYALDRDDPATAQCLVDWKANEPVFSYHVPPGGVKNYFAAWHELINGVQHLEPKHFSSGLYYVEAFMKYGCFGIMVKNELPDEQKKILARFAIEFERTYTRFLDLKKAEAQAREAQIQLALERVRARTMAMRTSDELAETSSVLFQQIKDLGFETWSCGFCIWKGNDLSEVWMAADSGGLLPPMLIPYKEEPTHRKIYEASLQGADHHERLWEGDELAEHYAFLQTIPSVKEAVKILEDSGLALPARQRYYVGFFNQGYLLLITKEPKDGASELSKRFASVFEQTYTRFLDLQRAETQAREAVKQASLDRVRGEIASMRTTNDLERITPLVWNELTILGIPFIRCGVFIIDEEAELIHTHLSTPDGKAIAAFALPFDTEGIGRDMLPAWRKKEMATVHWSAEEFAAYTKTLVAQGAIKSKGKYVNERPDTTLDLYFFPFSQGMLYAGNATPLTDEEKDLVQSLADAFSAAYARYDDFNKLEVAKQQVENTLTDLKAAQTKLIQSEKMASLGELTAGIAHEIQNPLNFVNNFSEVSIELLEELQEEARAGHTEDVIEIALGLTQNLQKINHHGKRADGIVKGMLQHSRTSSGEKQPTNLNAIADEFFKLSYHGLRAKDKTFNAELITSFDDSLPKVNVIPGDIGRVMLNLFNNAFYAVNQKAKTAGPDYKPTVTINTFAPPSGGWGASVRDNGIGMPDHIKDKIMQPFFTTKPTGEGTGLGLSLTYDMVVKGHGGSIQVNSIEGEGSEFIVALPDV